MKKEKNENWEKRFEKLVDNWEEIDWIDIKVFIRQLLKSKKTKWKKELIKGQKNTRRECLKD